MICPIMSRPERMRTVRNTSNRDFDEVPWMNVFECQFEKCMAWEPEQICCGQAGGCPGSDGPDCDMSTCRDAVPRIWKHGFCKLIRKEAP